MISSVFKGKKYLIIILFTISSLKISVAWSQLKYEKTLKYAAEQVRKTLSVIPKDSIDIPRSIDQGTKKWKFVGYKDWCSGFWPGVLWYSFEASGDTALLHQAMRFTHQLLPLSQSKALDHDLGFQIFNSYGNGYRITNNPEYKKVILATADTLATLFNPAVGTILSWPRSVPEMQWPQHNTIIDNMINLEMLFWAAKNGGNRNLYDMAVSHANVTMKNHFRKDYTSYHAVIYDRKSGKKIKGLTHQGYNDRSMWARGQSWAIYGYTMCYRETGDPKYLDFAQKVTNVYLSRLPADLIPYWDFDDKAIPNSPKDASAAAVTASALLELSTFVKDRKLSAHYRKMAERMLAELSSLRYLSGSENSAILLHSTGNKPAGSEINSSIIYADYYFMEAMLRLKKLQSVSEKPTTSLYPNKS